MASRLQRIRVRNYRCLRDVSLDVAPVNLLFGPNGVGKTTLLDALWFVRDCAIRGTDQAAADRHHGIGVMWDGAAPEERIEITVETPSAVYTVTFGYSSGRIEPFVGEMLRSKTRDLTLVDRPIGGDRASLWHEQLEQTMPVKLREPERPALGHLLLLCEPGAEARELDDVLRSIHLYSSRSASFFQLRKFGSETSHHTFLYDRWQNLWSALRNLHDRRAVDSRYDTIIGFMRQAFPGSFKDLVFDQLATDRVYASFVEEGRRQPIQSSGVSDGHLQLLSLLTALFGDQQFRFQLELFDEPETSLHPHAIAIYAQAVKLAAKEWNRQVFLATHSPVLMSQFPPEETLVVSSDQTSGTTVTRLSEVTDIRDLLDRYALGPLYMAEEIARQSKRP